MVLHVREYSSAYRLVFSISDDDIYHANSDWVWRQAIRTAWGNRWCVVSTERVSIVVVIVDDDPTLGLFLNHSQWPPKVFASWGLRTNAAFQPSLDIWDDCCRRWYTDTGTVLDSCAPNCASLGFLWRAVVAKHVIREGVCQWFWIAFVWPSTFGD